MVDYINSRRFRYPTYSSLPDCREVHFCVHESLNLDSVPVNLISSTEPKAGSRTVYELTVTLRRERHELAVTLRDFPSEETLTTYARVEP